MFSINLKRIYKKMSNYPVGVENDSNAPFNKEELQGETIGLFEYLENLEMPYEIKKELILYQTKIKSSIEALNHIRKSFQDEERKAGTNLVSSIINNISEPQIFIEE